MNLEVIKFLIEKDRDNRNLPSFGETNHLCGCGKIISYNGISSHSKICNHTDELKKDFFRKKYHIEKRCYICGKEIDLCSSHRRGKNLVFCSKECTLKAKQYVIELDSILYKECLVCSNSFSTTNPNKKTCSNECNSILLSNIVKDWHGKEKENNLENYINRNKKISQSSIGKKSIAWNKGLRGEEYLSHYEKENGENSFYKSLEKNEKFFRKTLPEIKFEENLIDFGCKYQYSFFTQKRQFDFLISTDNYCFIVEVDGDYWHKSRRLNFEEETILEQRNSDNEKALVINNIQSNKKFILLRVWEYHVLNDIKIWDHFYNLFKEINVNENISKIKEYYEIFS